MNLAGVQMNTRYIKTKLIGALGEKPMVFIQALRFVYLLYSKHNTDPEIALLPTLVRKGDTVIDVGASGANWTYWLQRSVGKTGFVYAFEADPYYALATHLAIKLLRLKGTRLFPHGLSDSDEEVPLRVIDSEGLRLSGLSHIDKNASKVSSGVNVVNLKRLDSLIREHPRLLTTKLIKCDVEGYELFVFRGAVEILDRSRPFVILETGNFETQGYSGSDLFEFFHSRHYASFALTGDNTLAPTNTAMEHEKALSVNRVLLPLEQITLVQDKIRILR